MKTKEGKNNENLGPGDKLFDKWNRLLIMLEQYRPLLANTEQINAYNLLANAIKDEVTRGNLVNPYSLQELNILKGLMRIRTDHPEFTYEFALDMVKRFLHINENTLPSN